VKSILIGKHVKEDSTKRDSEKNYISFAGSVNNEYQEGNNKTIQSL
jgi:hypothetical protein